MIRVILSVLGISQIMIMSRDSWRQWRTLRQLKKEYLTTLKMSSDNHDKQGTNRDSQNSNDLLTTGSFEEEEKIKILQREKDDITPSTTITTTSTPASSTTAMVIQQHHVPPVLKEYARLVLELKTQERKMIDGAKQRMDSLTSMPMVLCAVGFIPACISSLGNLYNEAATAIYDDFDISIIGDILIVLGVWCSFSIIQTILWYRIVPSYVHRKVAHKLVKPVVDGGKKIRPKIYHKRTLLKLLLAATTTTSAERGGEQHSNSITISPELLEQYQHEIKSRKLDKKVIRVTNIMIFLQFIYPFHDILNWLTYPIMLLFQITILSFLWWWPKKPDYNNSMRAQNMYAVWIFVINIVLVLAAPSPRDDDDGNQDIDDDDEQYREKNHHHHHFHHQSRV